MAEKRQLEVFQTPLGELKYPWITTADTRYNSSGVFQTQVAIPLEQAQDLIAQAERVRDDEYAKLDSQKISTYSKKDVYELEFTQPAPDASEEEKESFIPEPTGRAVFKCKLDAVVTPKNKDAFEQSVIVIDGDEAPVTLPIWGGTKAMVRGQLVPWANAAQRQVGVTFRMKAVKVLELVTGEGSTWSKFD